MQTSRPDVPWLDRSFFENQQRFAVAELLRYAGQHIAWSWDGTRVVASDPDPEVLDNKLRAAGIDLARVVYDYVQSDDVSS